MPDVFEPDFDHLLGKTRPRRDMQDSLVNFAALGQAIDTTWGRSSTPNVHTHSVKLNIDSADKLVASYITVVHFDSGRHMHELKRLYEEESAKITKLHIDAVKTRYKELTGKTLKVSEVTSSDSLEYIQSSPYGPKRTAYYRRKTLFDIA